MHLTKWFILASSCMLKMVFRDRYSPNDLALNITISLPLTICYIKNFSSPSYVEWAMFRLSKQREIPKTTDNEGCRLL